MNIEKRGLVAGENNEIEPPNYEDPAKQKLVSFHTRALIFPIFLLFITRRITAIIIYKHT